MDSKKFLIGLSIALVIIMGRFAFMLPSVSTGQDVPAIQGALLDGDAFDIKDLRGNYVLVDFWGSWCGPCLVEMPKIKSLYDKYEHATFTDADGFFLLNVAIESNADSWRRAIDRFDLSWKYHLADMTTSFKFIDSPIAKEFGVKQVPSKFLLDKNGVIISVNESVETLDDFLAERVK